MVSRCYELVFRFYKLASRYNELVSRYYGLVSPLNDGGLVICFGFNGPLRQYFSLYRAAPREGKGKEKR